MVPNVSSAGCCSWDPLVSSPPLSGGKIDTTKCCEMGERMREDTNDEGGQRLQQLLLYTCFCAPSNSSFLLYRFVHHFKPQAWPVAVFFLAGLCEIGGGWLVWQAVREKRPRQARTG